MIWGEKETRSTDVLLIEIADKDYEELFRSTSPLSRKVLAGLLTKLAKAKPAVIAVDIDLGGSTPEDKYLIDALQTIGGLGIPVVLSSEMKGERGKSASVIPRYPVHPPGIPYSGIINFPVPEDGVIREMLAVHKDPSGDIYPSFPLSVVAAFIKIPWLEFIEALKRPRIEGEGAPRDLEFARVIESVLQSPLQKIRYVGDRKSFNSIHASSLLSLSDGSFGSQNILSGKILLIGGTFNFSKDFYQTPKGALSGVEIIANSVETLLRARPLRPINHLLEFLLEIVIVLVLSYFFLRFSALKAIIVSFLSILPLSMMGSLIAFSSFDRWLNFFPVGLAIVVHGRFSRYEQYAHLKKDVAKLRNAIADRDREIDLLKSREKKEPIEKNPEEMSR